MRATLAVAAVCLLAACGGSTAKAPTSSRAARVSCADLLTRTVVDAEWKPGCSQPDGGLNVVAGSPCPDGTTIWQMSAQVGVGRTGKMPHAGAPTPADLTC